MKDNDINKLAVSNWYPKLADYTFPTTFTRLRPEELALLADGVKSGPDAAPIIARLEGAMKGFFGRCFVFADTAAPTDTERFAGRKGAVNSAASAWFYLASSQKVRAAAADKAFDCLCARPFRNMSYPREFRLFIRDGALTAMSQYWLLRHFRRLERKKTLYWEKAAALVNEIRWLLPEPTVVLDIYFTAKDEILLIDFNPWGPPTAPLMLKTWDRDWSKPAGVQVVPPPFKISGDVNVSP